MIPFNHVYRGAELEARIPKVSCDGQPFQWRAVQSWGIDGGDFVSWGCDSGPTRQLALAILLNEGLPFYLAKALHKRFSKNVLAEQAEEWYLTSYAIHNWIAAQVFVSPFEEDESEDY